jgi:Ger(x)C family germination protein
MAKRVANILYIPIILLLLFFFFTNDFGILDIHKTTMIVAVGVDTTDDEVQVTVQIALPQPSANGDNVTYTEVQGSGVTIAEALNEINAKTGFYPKLLFCKLILLGESCTDRHLFELLSCFYRKNYSELTALVAMCEGNASDMLSLPASVNSETSTAIQRVISDALEKSANVSSVTLRDIAVSQYSESKACYMPYVQAVKGGTSEKGGNGDSVGGESVEGQNQSGEGSEGGESPSSAGSNSSGEQVEFVARRTAIFSEGKFVDVLDEEGSFALNMLNSKVELAHLPCTAGDTHYTIGLKGNSTNIKLKVERGVPKVYIKYFGRAQIRGVKDVLDPNRITYDDVVSEDVLKGAVEEMQNRFNSLISLCESTGSDVLGLKRLLKKYNRKYFNTFKDNIYEKIKVEYDIKIKSLN